MASVFSTCITEVGERGGKKWSKKACKWVAVGSMMNPVEQMWVDPQNKNTTAKTN